MCTIASMPRLPEHCVEYVRMLLWPKDKPFGGTFICGIYMELGIQPQTDILVILLLGSLLIFQIFYVFSSDGVVLDGDDPKHIQWVFQKSLERAAEFNITGVTYRLTQGECHRPAQ